MFSLSSVYKVVIVLSSLARFAHASPKPEAFVVCALKGDAYDISCSTNERRFRDAGYEVHRIDGPQFKNRAIFEKALRASADPLIYVVGHGAIHPNGFHNLSLGVDGAKKSVPTHLVVEGLLKLNAKSQIFVESCQSGALSSEACAEGGCVGTSCRADEFSPVRITRDDKEKMIAASGRSFSPVLDLLNLPVSSFKYWSGGKCEIGGEELKRYLRFSFSRRKISLSCSVGGYEDGVRRATNKIQKDEAICEGKVKELAKDPTVNVQATIKYEFEVKCQKFKAGQTIQLFDSHVSREALVEQLARARPSHADAAPSPIVTKTGEAYFASDLAGMGCEPVSGFRAKHYLVEADFRGERDGQPSEIYGDHVESPSFRQRLMPFHERWTKGLPAAPEPPKKPEKKDDGEGIILPPLDEPTDTKPKISASRGMATPDFGKLKFRHARCEDDGSLEPTRRREGFSLPGLDFETH